MMVSMFTLERLHFEPYPYRHRIFLVAQRGPKSCNESKDKKDGYFAVCAVAKLLPKEK